ncbi:hypothetical protein F1K67_22950 [Vibrio parahaemolyticus]|nr:hypothetical protein [Vibrio parahaemolyticus]
MDKETLEIWMLAGTLGSAIGAIIAAFVALFSVRQWKKERKFETRRDALNAWVKGAVVFRGRLKFVYRTNLVWPRDKETIEYISTHYWDWVSDWPYAKASASVEQRKELEKLWNTTYYAYNNLMNGTGNVEDLGLTVEAIYNSTLLNELLESKS